MMIETSTIVTATEADQNFSRVAKTAEKRPRRGLQEQQAETAFDRS